MKKTLLSLLAVLLVSAFSATVAEPATVPESTYVPVPCTLYPAPEGGYVGDVMPFVDGDVLELYYLYDTDHNGQAYHPIHRFSTTDLIVAG